MKLRDYQVDATNSILKELKANDLALAVLHTGLGKAVIITKLVELIRQHRPSFRAVIMVKQVKLIKQMVDKFEDKSLVSTVCGTLNQYDQSAPFVVASFETLRHRLHQKYDLCIIDECHQSTKTMEEVAKSVADKVLGVTATPFNGKGFIYGGDKFWSNPCYSSTEKTASKYLCPIVLTGTKNKIDMKGLPQGGGDYVLGEAAERYTESILQKQIEEIQRKTLNRNKCAVVVCNIEHAQRVLEMLPNSTITHSKLNQKEQIRNMEAWELGPIKFMISVNQITTGFDFPALDCIIALRPTRSYTLYVQMLGRGRRKHPSKKDCLFLDYGNIVSNLGLLEDVETNIVNKKPSLKICPICDTFLPTSTKECSCGFSFILPPSIQRQRGDYEKNLSVYAYEEGEKVTAITSGWHVSGAGNRCLKIMYWQGMKMLHAVYFLPYMKDKINTWLESNIYPRKTYTTLEEIREQILNAEMIVKSITLVKKGKYKEIRNHRW